MYNWMVVALGLSPTQLNSIQLDCRAVEPGLEPIGNNCLEINLKKLSVDENQDLSSLALCFMILTTSTYFSIKVN